MFTFLNWLTNLPFAVCLTLFVLSTVCSLLLPWGVGFWRDRHGALPRRRKASWWLALVGAGLAFVPAFGLVGILVVSVLWAWVHSDNFHGRVDDMAAGLFFSLVIPLSCLVSALVYQRVRWQRAAPGGAPAQFSDPGASPNGDPAVDSGNSGVGGEPPSVS